MTNLISETIATPTAAHLQGSWTGLYPLAPIGFGAVETSAQGMPVDPQPANAVSRVRSGKQAAPPRGEVH